jgi:hypothetical protein
MALLVDRALEALQSIVAGDVFVPGDSGYDDARRAWNFAAVRRTGRQA